MFEAFSKVQWRRTLLLLVICAALAAAAGIVGIDDNLPGQSLALLSAIALVLAFVHPWRTSRWFLLLTGASVLVFIASTVITNVIGDGFAGGVFFFIAIWLCPAGFVVGIIGAVVTSVTSRRARHLPPAKPVT